MAVANELNYVLLFNWTWREWMLDIIVDTGDTEEWEEDLRIEADDYAYPENNTIEI